MSGSRKVSEQDSRLFKTAVGPVRRLRHDRVTPERPRPAPRPAQREQDEQRVLSELLADVMEPHEMETGEELMFLRPGLQHGLLRKLRRGHYYVNTELDLHGLTVATAKQALVEYLLDSRRLGHRCVRIIHGKGRGSPGGQPVLKQKLNHWLRQRDEVLAFASARPVDGGTGAVYVLLKRL